MGIFGFFSDWEIKEIAEYRATFRANQGNKFIFVFFLISTKINVNKVDSKIIINWPKIFVENLALKICVVKIENFRTEKTVGTNEGGVYNARYKVPKDFI